MPTCPACGNESPDGFKFCGVGGAGLEAAAPAREQRKTVTVLFCDVTGSTALGEQLDPEALRRTMGRYFDEIRAVVERHGGTVEKFIGDAVMAVFGIPTVHEDDALRAVRAAAEIRDGVTRLGEELSVALSFRTGVNTGQVVTGEGETLATGDAVNVAARLEQAAGPGEILIGADTLSLVRDAVSAEAVEPLALKGKREPVPAYRLLAVDLDAPAFARHLDAPLVGRTRELARLRTDFEDSVSRRACHLFTLLGPAGVGKSRLVAEFLAGAGDAADVLRGRCLHYGEDITYWPLVEVLIAAGVDPADVIGNSPAETQLSFRKLLETRALERPQILVLDDIQWAEPVFLDLVEHISDWSRDAPIFVLCVARPDLLEVREGWGGGKLNGTTILLDPLPREESAELIAHLAGGTGLTDDVRQRILDAADGNPLFLEEMLAMVGEDGGADVVVPPTIQALLQARLDRLGVEERDVIGRGSVEGQVFHRGAVQELASEAGRDDVATHLLSLVRKELIRPEQATLPDEDAFRFRHLLIRDAAYDSLPKETRAELHEQFAGWLERHGELVELDEIVGYHLERAYRNRAELDATDARLEGLARRAAARLEPAGRGALTRGDVGAARGLLGRAAALLPVGDEQRLRVLVDAVVPLNQAGESDAVRAIAEELHASPDPRFQAFGGVVSSFADFFGGTYRREDTQARMAAAREIFESLDEQLGLAYVEWIEGAMAWSALRSEETREAALRGLAHAQRAGAAWLAEDMVVWTRYPLAFGPTPVAEALRITEIDLSGGVTRPIFEGPARRRYARLLAMRGSFDQAREEFRRGIAISREAGLLVEAAAAGQAIAFVETRAGDLEAAEAAVRTAAEELDQLGDRAYYATLVLCLAETLLRQGREDEAETWCRVVRETTSPDDVTNVSGVDAIEGFLLARRGEVVEGERLARAAVEVAETTDFYEHRASAHELLAQTLTLVGKPGEALAAAEKALAIYEAKGDEPAAAWTRELRDSLR